MLCYFFTKGFLGPEWIPESLFFLHFFKQSSIIYYMSNLINFYRQHSRLFLKQKHQNTSQTENFRDMVILKFLDFCESKKVFHTRGITKKLAADFLYSEREKSSETLRKYFLVLREFFRIHKKIELTKEDLKLWINK